MRDRDSGLLREVGVRHIIQLLFAPIVQDYLLHRHRMRHNIFLARGYGLDVAHEPDEHAELQRSRYVSTRARAGIGKAETLSQLVGKLLLHGVIRQRSPPNFKLAAGCKGRLTRGSDLQPVKGHAMNGQHAIPTLFGPYGLHRR